MGQLRLLRGEGPSGTRLQKKENMIIFTKNSKMIRRLAKTPPESYAYSELTERLPTLKEAQQSFKRRKVKLNSRRTRRRKHEIKRRFTTGNAHCLMQVAYRSKSKKAEDQYW